MVAERTVTTCQGSTERERITTVSATAATAEQGGPLARHHFLLRRLHSLSGIIPIGLFVCFHLFTNMQIAFGTFQHEVDWIHSQPALLFAEIFGIWLPIAFHAGLGIVYTFTGKPNTGVYGYSGNWRYVLQRITGIVALVFIFFHIATLRWRWDIGGWYTPFFTHGVGASGQEVVPFATETTAIALQYSAIIFIGYVIGVLAVVYHFSNGLWTAAISWGITLSANAQKRFGYVCIALFLGLLSFGAVALYSSVTYPLSDEDWAVNERTIAYYKQTGEKPHKGEIINYTTTVDADGNVAYEFHKTHGEDVLGGGE